MTLPPLASRLLHRGIYSEQELLLDIRQCWHPTSPILLIICSQSCRGGGLQGRSAGYPSCHSNVRTVRGVADLVWKVFLVIKILTWRLSFDFWKAQCLSAAVTPSSCLLPCVDDTSGMMKSRDTALLCHNEEELWWWGDRHKEAMVVLVASVYTALQTPVNDSGLKNTDN